MGNIELDYNSPTKTGVITMSDLIKLSYLAQRKAVGILGLIFPFILIFGSWTAGEIGIETSLSNYYYSFSRDIFVGVLAAIGVFLLSYQGYDWKDRAITTAAGILLSAVAIFPCLHLNAQQIPERANYLFQFLDPQITGNLHDGAAALAFVLLGVMSFFQFTRVGPEGLTKRKRNRNRVFRTCGIIIWITVFLMIFLNHSPLFIWLESAVLWAFGISWLVKGQAFLKD